jgi:hypothetical protein
VKSKTSPRAGQRVAGVLGGDAGRVGERDRRLGRGERCAAVATRDDRPGRRVDGQLNFPPLLAYDDVSVSVYSSGAVVEPFGCTTGEVSLVKSCWNLQVPAGRRGAGQRAVQDLSRVDLAISK